MKTLGFVVRNFRNIGLCKGNKSQEAFLRLAETEGKFGGLVILLGKSNSGKSNLLRALEKFGNSYLSLQDSQHLEGLNLLSQDDMPKSQSALPSITLSSQEPAYYLHYPQDIAQKSGVARKKQQMGKSFDFGEHITELQEDFDNLDVYVEQNKYETISPIKLLLKDSSGGGRFLRCTIEPLRNRDDRSSDELNVSHSEKLACPFVVGYKALDAKQNFADYIDDPSQSIESSAFKEHQLAICLDENRELQQKYVVGNSIMQDGAIVSLSSHQVQEFSDKKREQLRVPKIVFYEETHFCDDDLSTTPDKIQESRLFKGGITEELEQISKDFNALCDVQENEEKYKFKFNFEEFRLKIYKGKQLLSLEEQGRDFRKLFDFIFSLSQQINGLQKGDIVLIDDVEESLSIVAQKELRKFLKKRGQEMGILFIVSTHSPFMIDCNCLDEIRLLKARDNGHGTEIVNDVSLDIAHQDSLLDYAIRAQQPNSLVFVEDIAMCHFLSTFALMYAQEKGRDLKLVFLPVPSLENKQERTKMLETLIDFRKNFHAVSAIFVVDKEDEWEHNEKIQIFIIRKQDSNETGFEYLFSEKDRERFGIGDANEARFLRYSPELVGKLDQETKDGFYKTLEVLHKEAYENEQDNEGGKA